MAESVQVKELKDWHESLLDFIIAHPHASLRMKAQMFGVTMSWVSIVENSDSFREKMALRRGEHFQNISNGLVSKLEATAEMVVEEINQRIEADGAKQISLNTLRDLSHMALTHLGFGKAAVATPGQSAGTIVNNNTIVVQDRDALRAAREAMAAARLAGATSNSFDSYSQSNKQIENEVIDVVVTPTKTSTEIKNDPEV